jgi:ABC-type Fe3+-hydroxamate transport system substrate-binding protein
VVSRGPAITETVVAIGGRRSLVGVTRYCTRPRGMLWGLPRVGGTKNPEVARILDLKPDVVLANAEENREEDVRVLREAGLEVDVTLPKAVGEVPGAVRRWGRMLEAEGEAEALASRIESELEGVQSSPPAETFRYVYWIWKDPWMTVSDDTYVADLMRLAGGVNCYGGEPVRYPTTDPEEAIRRGAGVHLFSSEPYPFRETRHGELVRTTFGPSVRPLFVPGEDFCWHGVRTLRGLRAVRALRQTVSVLNKLG